MNPFGSGKMQPPRPPKAAQKPSPKMPPPKAPGSEAPPTDGPEQGAKESREKALVVTSEHHCANCANYQGESGDCSKVEGSFDPEDACLRYYEPVGDDAQGPDADDQGQTMGGELPA